MSFISWIIFIFDIALAIDAARRPASAWAAADRRKAYWVGILAIFGFIAFMPYFTGVLPRLMRAGRETAGMPFQKRPSSPFEKG
ncbi:MAG: hypothetical protein ACRDOB_09990 [Streptosporangiaceae bacterium]